MSIRFTIDGKEVLAQPGQTVLQAALAGGIQIPRLCYHPALTPFAGCRLCIVEVKGGKGPIASCALPARDGMEVTSNSPKLFELRKTALDLIISDHPLNCLTCEKNGDCVLQKYAYEFGLEKTSYVGETTAYPNETGNPLIEMNYKLCVMCGRCVLACNEAVVNQAIDFTRRGFATKITTPLDVPRKDSDCTFCGGCVDVCPVGALTDKTARFKGRISETAKRSVICPYCGCGCSIILDIKDNQIIRSRGNPEGPANHGWLCVKGHFGLEYVGHPDRLTKCELRIGNGELVNPQSAIRNPQLPQYPSCALNESLNQSRERLKQPLIRKDGVLKEASWSEAIELIAKKFAQIKKEHGPDSLAVLASAKCSNEENYLMQKFCRVLFGNNNVDHCARLCHASTVAGLALSFGSAAMTNSIDEVDDANVILVIGSNTTEAHPIIGYAIKRAVNKGAKLIVCDPRAIEMTEFADVWLRHKCGTDVALINSLMYVILEEGLENKEFIKHRTEGFEEMKKVVMNYSPEKVAEIIPTLRVGTDEIRRAARIYATARDTMVIYSMGITQHTTGVDNVQSMANLVMLCGQIGKPSSGLNPLRGQSNVQGACDAGALPNVYPGYQKVNDSQVREKFEKAWRIGNVNPADPSSGVRLSDKPGLTVTEIIDSAAHGKIKGLYIMGENPMFSDPNINHVDEGLKNIEFLVVQDIFLTETAQRATVVLPAVSFAEKEGTYTNTERRVQLSPAVLKPMGESRPDWQILSEIGTRLAKELGINARFDYKLVSELTDELASVAPIYCGIKYHRLANCEMRNANSEMTNPQSAIRNPQSLQWPCPSEEHPGTKFLHKDKFTRGLGKFYPIEYKPPAEETDKEYPLVLTTGRVREHYHTGSMSRRATGPVFLVPEAFVEIHPADADALKVADGEKVQVASRRGSITIKARVTEKVPQGTVFIPFHFAEAAANILTNPAVDPVAKIPEFKVCAVHITKIV